MLNRGAKNQLSLTSGVVFLAIVSAVMTATGQWHPAWLISSLMLVAAIWSWRQKHASHTQWQELISHQQQKTSTATEQLEASEHRARYLDNILAHVDQAMFCVRINNIHEQKSGRISFANEYMLQNLGYTRSELFGLPLEKLVDNGNLFVPTDIEQLTCHAKITPTIRQFRRKDGKSIPMLFTASQVLDGVSDNEYVCTAQDVMEQKQAEFALWNLSRRLHLLYHTTLAANRASDSNAVLYSILEDLCGFHEWPVGRAYLLRAGGLEGIISGPIIYVRDKTIVETDIHPISHGVHRLLEEVIHDKSVVEVKDFIDSDFFSAEDTVQFRRYALRSALAFPVIVDGNVVAAVEFVNRTPFVIDSVTQHVIEQVCEQAGQVILRKKAEEELRLSQKRVMAAQDIAHIVSWDWDLRKNRLYLSETNDRLLGSTATTEVSVEQFITSVHPLDQEQVTKAIENILAGEQVDSLEFRVYDEEGNERVMQGCGETVQYEDGIPMRVIGIVQDITERVQADRAKREFISTVSHELRTPLTSIKGSLGLLLGGIMGELPPKMHSMIDIANRNSERLLTLINDILDLEKLEAGSMRFEFRKLGLNELLSQAVVDNDAYAKARGIELVYEPLESDVTIRGDFHRLMQVMSNLLSNAAKFSPKGSIVRVRADVFQDFVSINVIDQGRGIPEAMKESVFEKFTQVDSSDSRTVGGTGLGLSIVKFIVEKHGGKIDFSANAAGGTTFHFQLDKWDQSFRGRHLQNREAKVGESAGARRVS